MRDEREPSIGRAMSNKGARDFVRYGSAHRLSQFILHLSSLILHPSSLVCYRGYTLTQQAFDFGGAVTGLAQNFGTVLA